MKPATLLILLAMLLPLAPALVTLYARHVAPKSTGIVRVSEVSEVQHGLSGRATG